MHRGAYWLIRAVNAAYPTARSAHALFEFRAHPFNVLTSGFWFFHGDCPADPFIARKRREVFPCRERLRVRSESVLQVLWQFVDNPTGDFMVGSRHTSILLPNGPLSQGVQRARVFNVPVFSRGRKQAGLH